MPGSVTKHTYVVVVGRGPKAAVIAEQLTKSPRALRIFGVRRSVTIHRAATLDEARGATAAQCRDLVVVANEETAMHWRRLANDGVLPRFIDEAALFERLLGRVPLDLSHSKDALAQKKWSQSPVKRGFDIAFAVVLGVMLAPITVLLGLALQIATGRPGFVSEPRTGRQGKTFSMWGLDANVASSERSDAQIRRSCSTAIAWLIQRLRLESVPALWNLMRGDISIVGPLPQSPRTTQTQTATWPTCLRRSNVRPGLFGCAASQRAVRVQNSARALERDLFYIKYASFRLDLRIIARSIGTFFSGSQADPVGSATTWIPSIESPSIVLDQLSEHGNFPPNSPLTPEFDRTLIVGAGDGGKLLLREMQRNTSLRFRPLGFVDDDPSKVGSVIHGAPVLGMVKDIPDIVTREGIDVVVVAIPSASAATLSRISEIARRSTARVLTMPNLGALLRGEAATNTLRSVTINDVLGRQAVAADHSRCRSFISGKRVLITGAAGSIGMELTRQVAQLNPELIVAVDINESGLFDLCEDLRLVNRNVVIAPVVASVTNRQRLGSAFTRFEPEIVFHAAAYKHVPLMEEWPEEAVMVNSIGTAWTAQAAAIANVRRFVLVSTDKAVKPANVMGASKRIAELAVKAVGKETGLSTCSVRFGNVLGSRGSVIPLFERQIQAGGPVTVTHPDMMRYFMTIPEAASLIIEAGALGDPGSIYMLDMGAEVSILDLARRMINLSGLQEGRDIDIVFSGLRPGEKMREELSFASEIAEPTPHAKIRRLIDRLEGRLSFALFRDLARMEAAAVSGDPLRLRTLLFETLTEEEAYLADSVFLMPAVAGD